MVLFKNKDADNLKIQDFFFFFGEEKSKVIKIRK